MSSPRKKKGGKGKPPVIIDGEVIKTSAAKPAPPERDVLIVTDDLDERPIAGIEAEADTDTFKQIGDAAPANIALFEPKRASGRPTRYSDGLAEDLLCEIASGKTIAQVCGDDSMPSERTFYRWQFNNPDFAAKVAVAQRMSLNAIIDHARDIAHRRADDELGADIADRRLAIETEFVAINTKKAGLGLGEIIAPSSQMPGDDAKLVTPITELVSFEPLIATKMAEAAKTFEEKTGLKVSDAQAPT